MAPAPLPRTAARAGALLAALALILTGCSTADDGPDPQPAPDGASASADAPPAIVEEDGFYRSNTLPAPLAEQPVTLPTETGTGTAKLQIVSLDSNGEVVRLVGAWLQPVDGEGLASDTLTKIGRAHV